MFERNYVISGIKPSMAEAWYKEFKDVAKFSIDLRTGEYSMKMLLSLFSAIKVRIGMIGYNFGHKYKLKMKKCKGKHFRV